ncbi:MAG: DUF2817 domain-containing protein [Bdellovibrionia bacterium]
MLSDLNKLAKLVNRDQTLASLVTHEIGGSVIYKNQDYPLHRFIIGSKTQTDRPTLFITGGVHGIERIGAQLAWSLLKTTIDRLLWDDSLKSLFSKVNLVVMPLVNPVGYNHFMRSNGNGVDLMRNSPVHSLEEKIPLLSGHRLSPLLPWYQGAQEELEAENKILLETFTKYAQNSPRVIAIDFHSGFGLRDRLWFPYSYTSRPFENIAEMHSLYHLFEQTHPYHIYQFEPQSDGYLLNGDMWDHLYLEYQKKNPEGVFIPLTLEMGSWNWVKKNPLQLFSKTGIFNPIKEHRLKRVYRRHHLLFDFMLRALYSNQIWSELDINFKKKHQDLGFKKWYSK